jgi:hypothetical protein
MLLSFIVVIIIIAVFFS